MKKHDDVAVDYMARALLMPYDVVKHKLLSVDYAHLDVEQKKRFVYRLSDEFRVPVEHAFKRVKEVQCLMDNGFSVTKD